MSESMLKEEERIAFALRALYKKYGYSPYKMNKFEAYDLYVTNKDFLVGDGVITFNDTDGKLLALKPDVTLSIIKNSGDDGKVQKVYYHENVYRISGETKQFKEIPQVGLERIGSVGEYDVFETVRLAAESLAEICDDFVLDVSHLGVVSAVLNEMGQSGRFNREAMRLISEKNLHETRALCESYGVNETQIEKLLTLVRAYGDRATVLKMLTTLCESDEAKQALAQLKSLSALLDKTCYSDKIRFDFSVIHDMKYYNGIVFKGFVDGVCEGVLSGGQYDKLMQRMGKNTGAIGFAIYLDLLENFRKEKAQFDVDVLVLYDNETPILQVAETVDKLVKSGKSVRAQQAVDGVRFQEIVCIGEGGEK